MIIFYHLSYLPTCPYLGNNKVRTVSSTFVALFRRSSTSIVRRSESRSDPPSWSECLMKVLLGSFFFPAFNTWNPACIAFTQSSGICSFFCMDWVSVSSSVMLLQSKNSERLFFSTALKRTTMADTGSFTCDFARRRRPFARSAA